MLRPRGSTRLGFTFGGSSAALGGRIGALRTLCKKCRQTPIFTLLVFSHLQFTHFVRGGTSPESRRSVAVLWQGWRTGSTDAERVERRGTGDGRELVVVVVGGGGGGGGRGRG